MHTWAHSPSARQRGSAANGARNAKLTGYLLLAEIRRWEDDSHGLLRTWVEFKLVSIEAGATVCKRRVQKAVPSTGPRLDQTSADTASEIARDLFAG
jgi:hypothetical protein